MRTFYRSNPTFRFNVEKFAKETKVRIFAIYRYQSTNSDGERVKHRFKYSTGVVGPIKQWDQKAQKFKLSTKFSEITSINKDLERNREVIISVFQNTENPSEDFTQAKFIIDVRLGKSIITKGDKRIILPFYKDYIKKRSNDGLTSPVTIQRIQTSYNTFKEWLEYHENLEFKFDKFNRDSRDQFINYLSSIRKRKLSPTTVAKVIRDLKIVMKEALVSEFTTYDGKVEMVNTSNYCLNEKFVPERQNGSKHWLRGSELDKLYKYDLSDNPRLDRVRNIFLQSAYCGGIRISDIFKIQPGNFQKHKDGYILTVFTFKGATTKKSNKVVIPIKGIGQELWETSKLQSLERISEQKLNNYLKELCKLVGIDRIVNHKSYEGRKPIVEEKPIYNYVSFHTARYSYINIALHEKGFTPNEIMGITGQSLKTLYGYVQNNPEENVKGIFDKM